MQVKKHSTGALTTAEHAAQDERYRQGHIYDKVIIGSGMAALTAAALFAHAGERVCILEAHDTAGGYAHSFTYGGFSFCAQVHYIWGCEKGGHVYEFLKKIGLDHEITFELLDPSGYDRMVMPDGKQVRIPNGYDKLAENIEREYPGQGERVRKFTRILDNIRREVKMLPDRAIKPWEYITKGWQFTTLWWYQNKTLQDVFSECRLSKEAQAVLIAQAGDFMAPPDQLSIFAYTGLFGGYNTGAYYPTKHFNHFIKTIVDFITSHNGCHIYYETPVSRILADSDRISEVFTANGKIFRAKNYICNMDPQAASWMIGRDKFPSDYLQKLSYEYSDTGIITYLGLKISNDELHSLGFGNFNTWHLEEWDMNKSWKEISGGNYDKPWIFLGTPTLHSDAPGIAPPGCSILEVETLGNYDYFKNLKDSSLKAYLDEKARVRRIKLDLVRQKYIPDLYKHIAVKLTGSPTTNEDFCRAPRGNAYGSHLTPKNMGLGRLKSDTPFRNLRFCNASSGYGGVGPVIGTGSKLYMDLTGDNFYRPEDEPSDNVLIQIARKKAGGVQSATR